MAEIAEVSKNWPKALFTHLFAYCIDLTAWSICPVGTFWTFFLNVGGVVRLKIKIFVKLCHPHSQLKLEIENSDSLPVLLSRINCSAGYVYQAVGLPVESFDKTI